MCLCSDYMCYKDFRCSTFIAGEVAEWFIPERGVHQGAPLSMTLYQIYVNDLHQELRTSQYGAYLMDRDSCPAFADDCTAIAMHKLGLNKLMTIAHAHSVKWQYEFNTEKSVVMIWGRDCMPGVPVKLGNHDLKVVTSHVHLGVLLSTDKLERFHMYNERIGTAQKMIFAARGIGSASIPVTPSVLSKLYWSVIIPKLIYGLEVSSIDEKVMMELESAHKRYSKIVQNLPSNTPAPSTLATVGWLSMRSYIDMGKLLFLWQILCTPVDNMYRFVVKHTRGENLIFGHLRQADKKGPVNDMLRAASKYGMQETLRQCIINDNFGSTESRKEMTKRTVWEYEKKCRQATCLMYPELEVLYRKYEHDIRMNARWKFCSNHPEMTKKASYCMALHLDAQPKGMQRNIDQSKFKCGLCTLRVNENFKHVLFECNELEETRQIKWRKVLISMPQGMKISMQSGDMPSELAPGLLVSCLGGAYIREWDGIYMTLLDFVCRMYTKRSDMYDVLLASTW